MRACTPPIVGELEVLFFSNWEERGGRNNVDSKVEEIVIKTYFPNSSWLKMTGNSLCRLTKTVEPGEDPSVTETNKGKS